MQELSAAYTVAGMPFFAVEHFVGSRKRLVEGLRTDMRVTAAAS